MAEGGTPIGALAVRVSADIGDLIDGFNKADKATEKFSRQLDKRLLDPLAKVSAAAAAAGAAVFAFTKGAADLVDELGKMAQKVGVTVEALSGLKYAAELSDVSIEQLGTGLKQLSKFMVENKIEGVGVEEQLLRIADEFARTADNEYKTAAAMKYFGKSGAELIPLLNQGRAGIEELRKEAERLGVVFSSEAAKKAEEFNDNLTRLKASAQGLQVQLAGPLVQALNETAKAMLEARNRGESFFSTMIEGWRTLLTGTDAHKWNVEFTKATSNLLEAQNKLDKLRAEGGKGHAAVSGLLAAEVEVAKAKAEIDRLRAIKPILAPEEPAKEDKRSGNVTVPGDPNAAQSEREFIAKQLQEGHEEEQRIQLEAWAVMAELRQQELEKEKAWREERTRIALEAIDRETEAYENQLRTEAEIMAERDRREKEMQATRIGQAQTFFGNMALLMQTNSEKMFKIGKQAAIAETIINTYKAAMGAYSAMASIPYVGPILGAAAAAAAITFGLAQVQQIRAQSFNGGGGGPGPVATASPTTGLPTGTPGGDVGASGGGSTTRIFNINVSGSNRAVFEEFAKGMNSLSQEGFQFRLNPQ